MAAFGGSLGGLTPENAQGIKASRSFVAASNIRSAPPEVTSRAAQPFLALVIEKCKHYGWCVELMLDRYGLPSNSGPALEEARSSVRYSIGRPAFSALAMPYSIPREMP